MVSQGVTEEFRLALREELGIELESAQATQVLDDLVAYLRLLMEIDNRDKVC